MKVLYSFDRIPQDGVMCIQTDVLHFDILGEFTTTEAIEQYILWVINRLMHLLRET